MAPKPEGVSTILFFSFLGWSLHSLVCYSGFAIRSRDSNSCWFVSFTFFLLLFLSVENINIQNRGCRNPSQRYVGKKRGNDHGVPIAEGREGGKEKKRERSASFALHTWQDYNRKVVSTVYPSSLSKHPAENPKPIFLFLFFEERKKNRGMW